MTLETMQRKLAELEAKEQTATVLRAIAITKAAIERKVERQTATAPWWR